MTDEQTRLIITQCRIEIFYSGFIALFKKLPVIDFIVNKFNTIPRINPKLILFIKNNIFKVTIKVIFFFFLNTLQWVN